MDADDNNIFLWRSWDHFNVTDADVTQDLTASYIESVHMNAIEIDHDGNLLISSRNLNEVSKIDYETGEFIWRLGGRNNQFIWVNDEYQISYQHDIRVLENGNYTVYDNGIFRIVPDFSRGLEVKIDTAAMTVTKVWEFVNDPVIASKYLGNVQRLPNGNTLINWAVANAPKLTEVRPDGTKAFEMDFVNSYECYRTFRFQWKGKAAVPYLVAESWLDRITLIFNKFGDPDVARYNIYGGADPAPDNLLATSAQPYINLINLPGGQYYYFRVTSTNNAGEESAFSNEEKVFVQSIPSGQNMVVNGDFTNGLEFWELTVDSMKAEAGWRIDSTGVLHMEISDGGDYFENILITYPNIRLVNTYSYLFEFDARASGSRIIEAEVAMQREPYESYSRIGYTLLTPERQHFRFGFSMKDPTDFTGAIVFRVGGSAEDVFIDNVSLKELPTGTESGDQLKDTGYVLYPNFPNPFNPVTTIRYQLPAAGHTKITVYNLLGEQVKILADRADHAGIHEVRLDATGLSSGIYIYRIRTRATGGKDTFTASGKMLLMR
jgi:hypothetical protein